MFHTAGSCSNRNKKLSQNSSMVFLVCRCSNVSNVCFYCAFQVPKLVHYENISATDWRVPEPIVCHFFIIFFTFVYRFFIHLFYTFVLIIFYHFVFVFRWLFEIHQILPSVHHMFLIFWSKKLQNPRNPWGNRRKWGDMIKNEKEMIKNEKEMIKKWKIND